MNYVVNRAGSTLIWCQQEKSHCWMDTYNTPVALSTRLDACYALNPSFRVSHDSDCRRTMPLLRLGDGEGLYVRREVARLRGAC